MNPATGAGSRPQTVALSVGRSPTEKERPVRELREELRKHYVYKDNRGRIGNFFLPGCREQIRAIDDALADAVPELSADFFADIRHFNESFSRAVPAEENPDS